MILSLDIQIKLLMFDILAGVLTGCLFDIYKIIRGENYSKFINFIEDILFWILVSIIIFIFLSYNDYAYFEFYCYVYIALGFIIYVKFFSKYFKTVIYKISGFIYKIIRIIGNIVIFFIKSLLKNFKIKKL